MSNRTETAQTTERSYPSLWRNWNFLRLLFGRLVTNAGDSLYAVAAMWLVHDLTQSTVYTGIAEAMILLPLVLGFISGPLVDRWPIIRALVTIQIIQAVAILSLPLALYTGNMSVGLLLVTIPALAFLNQFVYPAQSAALPQIISNDQLVRGNSAFKFANHGLDMLFEALGGVLIVVLGAASLFLLDSVTFILAAILFVGVNIPNESKSSDEESELNISEYFGDMAEGLRCLRGTVFIEMTLMTAVTNFGTGMALAVLPGFAGIRSGPAFYGAMLGALGLGRVIGSVIAPRIEHVKYGHTRIVGGFLTCVLWIGSAYIASPALAVCLFMVAWIPNGILGVMSSTLMQTVTPKHLLGRVSSVTSSGSSVTLPIGALFGGVVGSVIGPVNTMAISGLGFGFVTLYFAFRPKLRRLPAMNNIDPTEFKLGGSSDPDSKPE